MTPATQRIGAAPVTVSETIPGAEWNDFVRANDDGTFCHLAAWHDVLAGTLGATPKYLTARDAAGALVGVLPLVRVKTLVLGDYLVSVPFLNYGGALGAEHARSALADHALEMGRTLGVKAVELRSRRRERSRLARVDRKIIVVRALPSSEDELWTSLPSKLRSQVRRPRKEGMEVRTGMDQLPAFYAVFARNMRDLGTPVLPRRFFEAAAASMPAEMSFHAVYHQGRPVAGGCGFVHRQEFEITWASSLREFNRLSPNMLLYWELMRYAIGQGAVRFNFGRCTPGGSTHRFKTQWGGEDVPLGWSAWSASDNGGPPSPDRPLFRLATTMWQKLPLAVSNRIGPHIAKGLP